MQSASSTTSHLTTGQFAAAIGRSPQTVRSHHCHTGQAFGIRPIKVGRLLLWPTDKVSALLGFEDKQHAD